MKTFSRWTLLLLLVMLGLELGAGIYEARVVVPLWAHEPQAAHAFWLANPQFAPNPGQRWWMFSTPFTGLVALCVACVAGYLPRRQSKVARIGAIVIVLMTVVTFAYFVPTIMQLQGTAVEGMSAEVARSKAALWTSLNWVRVVVYFAGWFLVIRAVMMSSDHGVDV
jgi:hypothetical protein